VDPDKAPGPLPDPAGLQHDPEPSEFEKFEDLMRGLLKVPKKAIKGEKKKPKR
jgi:hypothetical protein